MPICMGKFHRTVPPVKTYQWLLKVGEQASSKTGPDRQYNPVVIPKHIHVPVTLNELGRACVYMYVGVYAYMYIDIYVSMCAQVA